MSPADILGAVAAILVVSTFAGVLIGKWLFLANAQQHRGLRHEHGSGNRNPDRTGRLSVGGEISNSIHGERTTNV